MECAHIDQHSFCEQSRCGWHAGQPKCSGGTASHFPTELHLALHLAFVDALHEMLIIAVKSMLRMKYLVLTMPER
jgi:hypothetical protein